MKHGSTSPLDNVQRKQRKQRKKCTRGVGTKTPIPSSRNALKVTEKSTTPWKLYLVIREWKQDRDGAVNELMVPIKNLYLLAATRGATADTSTMICTLPAVYLLWNILVSVTAKRLDQTLGPILPLVRASLPTLAV